MLLRSARSLYARSEEIVRARNEPKRAELSGGVLSRLCPTRQAARGPAAHQGLAGLCLGTFFRKSMAASSFDVHRQAGMEDAAKKPDNAECRKVQTPTAIPD